MCHFHREDRGQIDIELEDEEITEPEDAETEPLEAEEPEVLADGGE